jgi:hypothetical protein
MIDQTTGARAVHRTWLGIHVRLTSYSNPVHATRSGYCLLVAVIQASMQCTIGARQFLSIHPSAITHTQGRQNQFSGHDEMKRRPLHRLG